MSLLRGRERERWLSLGRFENYWLSFRHHRHRRRRRHRTSVVELYLDRIVIERQRRFVQWS